MMTDRPTNQPVNGKLHAFIDSLKGLSSIKQKKPHIDRNPRAPSLDTSIHTIPMFEKPVDELDLTRLDRSFETWFTYV